MAQSAQRTPESIKAQQLAAKLLQQAASANTGPYTSGAVTGLKAIEGLMGGVAERQAAQADAAGQAQSNATLAAALRAYAAGRDSGAGPSYGAVAAASPVGSSRVGSDAVASGSARNPAGYDPKAVEAMIRARAPAYGIDPDIAVRVARSEGLNVYHGDNGSSFGPFQLHYGGVAGGGNSVGGLGDAFTRQTKLDARDPSTVPQQIDFSLKNAAQGGWIPWHGAKNSGISQWAGIGQAPTRSAQADMPAPGAQPVASSTLPPGITPDMVSAQRTPYFFGDSIAQGLQGAARGQGDAAVGRSPAAVLAAIRDADPASLQGRDVVLSSGASNDPSNAGLLGDQIAALRDKGVDPSRVRVVGVGSRQDFAGLNDRLGQIAAGSGATFAGPLASGRDGVHPADYGAALSQVQGAGGAPSPFGASPRVAAQGGPPPAVLAAALRQGAGPGATPLPPSVQQQSPFGGLPATMDQAQPAVPQSPMLSAPAPDPATAPPLNIAGPGSPAMDPQPLAAQGGAGGPSADPALLAQLLGNGNPLQGGGSMLPATAPMPPPRPDAVPASVFGSDLDGAPALSPKGLQLGVQGPGGVDPAVASDLQARLQGTAPPAAGLSTPGRPGFDSVAPDGSLVPSMAGLPNGYAGGVRGLQAAMNGGAAQPQPDPGPAPPMPVFARASANPPAVLAAALSGGAQPQPATSPGDQPAGAPGDVAANGLPQTGPMPPVRPTSLTSANPDAPAPNAAPAGPAPAPAALAAALRGPQPLGLQSGNGVDPSSPLAFLRGEAARVGGQPPALLGSLLRGQAPATASAAPPPPQGGGFDLGGMLGGLMGAGSGGNPLSGLLGGGGGIGGLFGGGAPSPTAGAPTAAQGGGMLGGLGSMFGGGQPQAVPSALPAAAGGGTPDARQAAINAALADPRISDSVKLKLMEPQKHSYAIAPNGQMYDSETGRLAGGNFEKPTPQQSIVVGDKAYAFDPATGAYHEQISSGAGTPTSDMKNYDAYAAQETAAGRQPLSRLGYDTALKQAGRTEVTVDNRAENAEAQARGAGLGKRMNDIADDSSKVNTEAIQLARIRDLLGQTPTGPGTAYAEKFRQTTGIALDRNTDRVQALNAAIQNLAPALRVPGSGSQSDTELRNFQQSIPNLQGTPGGNEQILRTLEGAIAYRQQRSAIAQKWQEGDITAKEADAQIAALPSPFASTAAAPGANAQPQVGAPDGQMARPQSKADYDALPSGATYVAPDGRTMRKS